MEMTTKIPYQSLKYASILSITIVIGTYVMLFVLVFVSYIIQIIAWIVLILFLLILAGIALSLGESDKK